MQYKRTDLVGKIIGLYVRPPKEEGKDRPRMNEQVPLLSCNLAGIEGEERHYGHATLAGVRESIYAKGTRIRNDKQWLAISPEEVDLIDENLSLGGKLRAEHIGANLLIEGMGPISQLPMLTRLVISESENYPKPEDSKVVLIIKEEVLPCKYAGRALDELFGTKHCEKRFPKSAMCYRGARGWFECKGVIMPGHYVYVDYPTGKG